MTAEDRYVVFTTHRVMVEAACTCGWRELHYGDEERLCHAAGPSFPQETPK